MAGCASSPPAGTALACPVYVSPVKLPAPIYPEEAIREGLSDTCESRFDIDWRGRPFNLDVRCTRRIFADSAEAALRATEFDPKALDPAQAGGQCASHPFASEISS
jgi:protein TonB